jgi:hypothetical protein
VRLPQPRTEKTKGSQKLIQDIINDYPEVLNDHIRNKIASLSNRKICWVSPLKIDEYAEYRDTAFLNKLGLGKLSEKMNDFWPKNGPQWDALGKTTDGKVVVLVEAKANVPELASFCGAKDTESLKTISERLNETQRWLTIRGPYIDWKSGFYQYANRLAHLYFLRKKAKIESYLIFLYLVGDSSHIRTSQDEWKSALKLQKKLLGLTAESLTGKVIDLFINTDEIIAV